MGGERGRKKLKISVNSPYKLTHTHWEGGHLTIFITLKNNNKKNPNLVAACEISSQLEARIKHHISNMLMIKIYFDASMENVSWKSRKRLVRLSEFQKRIEMSGERQRKKG